jgi:hypothetical protein
MRRLFYSALTSLLFLRFLLVGVPELAAQVGDPEKAARRSATGSTMLVRSIGTPTGQPPTLEMQIPRALSAQAGSPEAPGQGSTRSAEVRGGGPDYLLISILILAFTGAVMVAFGSALKRKP